MKILIVDDERLVRITLESMLMDICREDSICQVRNASEMTEMLRSANFDLVFLDINMPKQTGLDAMEMIQKECPATDWCILTGYSEFAYAKKALELGAKGYLLKPPDPEELLKFMKEIKKDREAKHITSRSTFTDSIQKGLYLDDYSDIENNKEGFIVCTFFIDAFKQEMRKSTYHLLFERIDRYMKERNDKRLNRCALFFHGTGELCLIFPGRMNLELKAFLRTRMADRDENIFIHAFYTHITNITDLKKVMEFQSALAPLRFYYRNHDMIATVDLEKDPMILKKQYFCVQLEQLLAEYATGEMEKFHLTLKKGLSNYHEEEGALVTPELKKHIETFTAMAFVGGSAYELLSEMGEKLVSERTGTEVQQNLITKICQYVSQNYMSDVSIDKMGDVFNITPTYLSRVFREKTGRKYIEYVTGIRMERAREFLQSGKYSIREISELVGYTSEKHFSRTYKKYYGISPSQDVE